MPFSSSQLLEIFVLVCIVEHFRYDIFKVGSASVYAESKSGSVRRDSMPTRLYRFITPIQALTYFPFPTIYIFAVASNKFQQPPWMYAYALPVAVYGVNLDGAWKIIARALACLASISLHRFCDYAFEHLDDQFHVIGRREKQRIVQSGPYASIRHPIYTWILLEEAFFSLMFWSYVPLFALVATATVLVVKIGIEEGTIQRDEVVGEEYRAYMKRVPARLIPHVW